MLMEEEAKKSETALAETVTKLAVTSKEADNVLKSVKVSITEYLVWGVRRFVCVSCVCMSVCDLCEFF